MQCLLRLTEDKSKTVSVHKMSHRIMLSIMAAGFTYMAHAKGSQRTMPRLVNHGIYIQYYTTDG